MPNIQTISPCLWFDHDAEQAVAFYTSVFPDSRILRTAYYTDAGREIHGKPAGSVMYLDFELAGQRFAALNGGPHFKLSPAVSLQVHCQNQQEIDRYWELLGEGGPPEAQQCGWLTDRFGLSWQVVPAEMGSYYDNPDPEVTGRVTRALLEMQKLDIATLRRAAAA